MKSLTARKSQKHQTQRENLEHSQRKILVSVRQQRADFFITKWKPPDNRKILQDNYPKRILCPAQISFKNEDKIKTFSKKEQNEFATSGPTLKAILNVFIQKKNYSRWKLKSSKEQRAKKVANKWVILNEY